MTKPNAEVNGFSFLMTPEAHAARDAEVAAEVEAIMVAAMGADGFQAFLRAPSIEQRVAALRAAGRHVGVAGHA